MQGRTDQPLNETGIRQAKAARSVIGPVSFDRVYSSPLQRAVRTASIIGQTDEKDVIIDPRIIEVDFGRYEKVPYGRMGLPMTLHWLLPLLIPAPKTVESVDSMRKRSASFLEDLLKEGSEKGYENVLITCHGGIMRALSGYLLGRRSGLMWYPKPRNCEIRVFDADTSRKTHQMEADYKA